MKKFLLVAVAAFMAFGASAQRASSTSGSYESAPATTSDDFEQNRKSSFWEITYSASDFDAVKESGTYGFSWTILPWKLANKVYVGIHFSPLNLNYGLGDYNFDQFRLGPAFGFYLTPKVFINMPVDVLCNYSLEDNDEIEKTTWGMAIAPSINFGGKVGLFVGPQLTFGFSEGSDTAFGFRAGIYF